MRVLTVLCFSILGINPPSTETSCFVLEWWTSLPLQLLRERKAFHIKHVAKSAIPAIFILPCCVLHTGFVTLSNGIPWNITRVTCFFSVYRRVSVYQENASDLWDIPWNTTRVVNNCFISLHRRYCHSEWPSKSLRRMMGSWVLVNTVEYTTPFLYSDWLYFLWRGINRNIPEMRLSFLLFDLTKVDVKGIRRKSFPFSRVCDWVRPTITNNSLGTNLRFWCFCAHARCANNFTCLTYSPTLRKMLKTTTCNLFWFKSVSKHIQFVKLLKCPKNFCPVHDCSSH